MGLAIGLHFGDQLPPVVKEELELLIATLQTAWPQSSAPTGLVESGMIVAYGGSTAPSGWVLCNGAVLNRVEYGSLFAAIRTTYGAGDGSTTFAVPNIQGRFPLGKATSGTGATLGETGGALDHTHTMSGTSGAGSSHTHTFLTNVEAGGQTVAFGADFSAAPSNHNHNGTTDGEAAHTHGVGSYATAAANPAYVVVNYIIKT